MDDLQKEKWAVDMVDKNIDDPSVVEILVHKSREAAISLGNLLYSNNDNVKLAAARDILDRSGYKPVERKDITSGGLPIQTPEMEDDKLIELIDGYLKRTTVDVTAREVKSPEGDLPPGS